MNAESDSVVQVSDVEFTWEGTSEPVIKIDRFDVQRGERVFLQGPSGSGKTTLLSLIAAVLTPQKGSIHIDGTPLRSLKRGHKDQFRVDRIGLVFQQFNLLPFLSVRENVQLSCRFSATRRKRVSQSGQSLDNETDRLLAAMNLEPATVMHRATAQLSVGQQQRVAVARALIGSPPLIIADEPTSSLDSDARQAFLQLLFSEVQSAGSSLLFVSHDASLAKSFDRHIDLRDINQAASPSIGGLPS